MATRPAKRQRRSTIVVTDDEDDPREPSNLPVRTQHADTKPNLNKRNISSKKTLSSTIQPLSVSNKPSSTKTSPTSSPQKIKKTSKQAFGGQNNKSLHSFFGKATEEQRWQRRQDTPQQESQEDLLLDDIVDDDSFENDLASLSSEQASQNTKLPPAKSIATNALNSSRASTPSASQRFSRPATSTRLSEATAADTEQIDLASHTPWSDRFGPSNIDELAIHKKKVADVQKWLEDACMGRSPQKILVLKGPAGAGKSTSVTMIAEATDVQVISWHNPTVSDAGLSSSIQQFTEFLDRGGQYEALSLDSTGVDSQQRLKSDRQILLIEEFPVSITRLSNVLESFRLALLQHILRAARSSQIGLRSTSSEACQPVVLIISETLLTSSTAFSDSFTAHRLLGPELLHHPLVSVIEFNPVAPTFISKALDLVVKKEARESRRRRLPGAAVMQQLSEIGDIRSAINSLEFLCVRGEENTDWSGTVAARSKKSSKGNAPLTEAEKNSLQLISQRESTLDMFHAAGKILYNKREDPRVLNNQALLPPKPPDHLMHLYSPKASQVDVDALLNETGTDLQTFICTIHENYVLSCNGNDFVDALDNCARCLSESDFLNPESRSLIRSKGASRSHQNTTQSGNSEMLRQDEISFQVASRGLLFSLPFPVNRAVPNGMRKQDAFKMFYPASLRLWKAAEEIHDLISLYATGMNEGDVGFSMRNKSADGVASWKSRALGFGSTTNQEDLQDSKGILARSFMSKNELATELLPYLTMIQAGQRGDLHLLKKITQLRGINIVGDEATDEEQYEQPASTSTAPSLQQKVEEAHRLLQKQKSNAKNALTGATLQTQNRGGDTMSAAGQEKLYISDDDILDD